MAVNTLKIFRNFAIRQGSIPILLLLLILGYACRNTPKADDGLIVLHLKLNSTGRQQITLEELGIRETTRMDSVVFTGTHTTDFSFPAKESGFYLLRNQKGDVISLLLQPGEVVTLEMNADQPESSYRVEGSAGSEILRQYAVERAQHLAVYDSLKNEFKKAADQGVFPQIRNRLDSSFQVLVSKQRSFILSAIRKNPRSLSGLFLLNQFLGPVPLFDLEENPEPFLFLDSVLMLTEPRNSHVEAHHARVQKYRDDQKETALREAALKPGVVPPDLHLTDENGKSIRLKDFAGKRVLLYFWQSVNAPSRKENLALRKLWMQKPKNAVLLCISMDENPEMAAAARRIDDLPGIHLNDPTGLRGSIAQKFNLTRKLPRYFWMGTDGKIIRSVNAAVDLKTSW